MKGDHLLLGKAGEEQAARYLLNKGYVMLARNWRFGRLELDLVCKKAETIVFVEVKTRSSTICGGAQMAITPRKKSNLSVAAQAWLNLTGQWERPCRFDIICITGKPPSFQMEHFQNAFDLSGTLYRRHSNW